LIPPKVANSITHDIFGNPAQVELGLVDAERESMLDGMLASLEGAWNENESCFHTWFRRYSRDVAAISIIVYRGIQFT